MGSCVSRSTAAAGQGMATATATAMVVEYDGSMARFAEPVTAREAMGDGRRFRGREPCFVCSSDELYFDAPVRALAAGDELQAGQLYFVLPVSMLGRPLRGEDMAALAVKASAALGASAIADDLPPRGKNGGGDAVIKRHDRRRQKGRVAPLAVEGEPATHLVGRGNHTHKTVSGDRTVGKATGTYGAARRRASVQRLSAIAEDN